MPTIIKDSLDPKFDELTGGTRSINEVRHLLHTGRVFVASETYISAAKDSVIDILLRTGSTKETAPHVLDLVALCELPGSILYIYGGPTVTDQGSSESSFNMNLQSTRLAKSKVYTSPTISAPGGLLAVIPLPGGFDRAVTPELSVILPPNTDFLMRINVDKESTIRFIIKWYEQQRDTDLIKQN